MSKKWICKICGYVHTGDEAPEFCPQCKAPSSKFEEQSETELVSLFFQAVEKAR